MRIIDADALKEDLRQYFTDGVLDGISARLAFNQILHDIDNAPTVGIPTELCKGCRFLKDCETCEEKLRPQGEWVEDIENLLYRCSNCNASSNIRMFKSNLHFCPNCGADMRGKENEIYSNI